MYFLNLKGNKDEKSVLKINSIIVMLIDKSHTLIVSL